MKVLLTGLFLLTFSLPSLATKIHLEVGDKVRVGSTVVTCGQAQDEFKPKCNVYGCSKCGTCNAYGCPKCESGHTGGSCNAYGCWDGKNGGCNAYGCSNIGECSVYGCPESE